MDSDILTNRVFTLVCDVDGAPFPEVIWTKDGQTVNYTQRMYLDQYNGSLQFANVQLDDAGVYQCFASNFNGSTESINATLTISGAIPPTVGNSMALTGRCLFP